MINLNDIQAPPDSPERKGARERLEALDDHEPCRVCDGTGLPVVDGGGLTTVTMDGCECGRMPARRWRRRYRRAQAAAAQVEVVTRRARG